MENASYLFGAFTIIWALVFAYVLSLIKKQGKIKKEIESLKETIKEKGTGH